MRAFLIAATAMLAGCAAQYGDMGLTGGVTAEQMSSDTWRISAAGNAYTSSNKIQDFVLLKSAETTKAAGGTHFIIAGSRDATQRGTIVTPGTAQTTVAGSTAYTTFTPGDVHTYVKPGQDAYVRVVRVTPGMQPPPGALSADEIIRFIGPRLKRGA